MKAEQYKNKPTDSSRRPKKFNAFASNDFNAQKSANYADKKDTLLKITTEQDDVSIDSIKVDIISISTVFAILETLTIVIGCYW
jgi:hypothetical protein